MIAWHSDEVVYSCGMEGMFGLHFLNCFANFRIVIEFILQFDLLIWFTISGVVSSLSVEW